MNNKHTHSLMNGKSAYIHPLITVCTMHGACSLMMLSNNVGLQTTDEYLNPGDGW